MQLNINCFSYGHITTKSKRYSRKNELLCHWVFFVALLTLVTFLPSEAMVLFFIIGVAVLSIKHPIFIITAIQFSLLANNYFGQYWYLNYLLTIVLLISFAFNATKMFSIKKDDLFVFIFFAYCFIIMTIFGHDSFFILLAIIIIVLIGRFFISTKKTNLSEIIIGTSIALVFCGIIGLKENSFGLSNGAGSVSRFLTSYGDPNFYCLVAVACMSGLVSFKSKFKYLLLLPLFIFCALTFSKSFILLAVINLFLLFLQSKYSFGKKITIVLASAVAVSFIAIIIKYLFKIDFVSNYISRFLYEGSDEISLNSLTTGRTEIQIKFANYFFTGQDIFGMMFGQGYMSTRIISEIISVDVTSTHMFYLQILMDFGVLGFVSFIYLFSKSFINASKAKKRILITYLIGMLFLSWPLSVPYFLLYFILGKNDFSVDS